jgi:hypothetical protein
MSAEPRERDRRPVDPKDNCCPLGHAMRLHHVEIPPRRVIRRGGVGGWELGVSYNQWVCDTCGHRGIPLPATAPAKR